MSMNESGFGNVIGHASIIKLLQTRISTDRVAHAFIFDGADGMGKNTLAKAFAKTLQCEENGIDACGACLSCRVFESGNHPDVLYVKASKTKSIGVDDVREQLILPMSEKPFRYRYKLFIVDAAETMTPAAQNALLKTIEEPAAFGIFLFLAAHTHPFLPTVLSRCVVLKLKPLPDALVESALLSRGIPEDASRLGAAMARGNIGQALAMSTSEDFISLRALAMDVATQIRSLDIPGVLGYYRRIEPWKDSIHSFLDMLYVCYRDLIVLKTAAGTPSAAGHSRPPLPPELTRTALETPLNALLTGADAITQTKRTLRQNGNLQLTMECLLLKLNGAI